MTVSTGTGNFECMERSRLGGWLGRTCQGPGHFVSVSPQQLRLDCHSGTERFCLADSCCSHLWALLDSRSTLPQSAKALTDSKCVGTKDGFIRPRLQVQGLSADSAHDVCTAIQTNLGD